MVRTYFNKLVRDKIPDIIRQEGNHPECHIAKNKAEYCQALREKILEEAIELKESQDVNELIDVLEAIYCLIDAENLEFTRIEELRKKKNVERGGFKKRIILEYVERKST
ncbi:nucleoside triphosphate pyrophosphohydrolase [Candidatus Borrarchaeum sp.]|uniref:nucleoside triphosphate pyrophosphohydrolase n=1 Tax=Candidatus Borrarchaeum sp. TaxID=2846742 RepID=UPI00257BFCC1|nr:nucleoside triphosphate pyrophosphohydrolase [Candidatus Borrarchaeum sp.]